MQDGKHVANISNTGSGRRLRPGMIILQDKSYAATRSPVNVPWRPFADASFPVQGDMHRKFHLHAVGFAMM